MHNSSMGQRRLLVILLIAATVLVDLAVGAWARINYRPGLLPLHWVFMVFLGLAISQANLAAALPGLGMIPLPWGLASVVLTTACLSGLSWLLSGGPNQVTRMMVLLLANAIAVLAATAVARMAGARIVATATGVPPAGRGDRPRFQFTLGRMFAWTTCTAVILGILQYTMRYELIPTLGPWHELVVVCLVHPALALAAVWTVLALRPSARRITLLGLALVIAILADNAFLHPPDLTAVVILVLPQLAWLVAALVVLRVAGYRLVRLCAPSATATPQPKDGGPG